MNRRLLGKFGITTSNFPSLNFISLSWVLKHNNFSSNVFFINAVVCAHSNYRHSQGKLALQPLLKDPLQQYVTIILFAVDSHISNLNVSLVPPSTCFQLPAAHLYLDTLSSHCTMLTWKGTHHPSSQSSLPVSVNHAIIAPKRKFFKLKLLLTHNQTHSLPPLTGNLWAFYIHLHLFLSGSP